jgi:hypothetical protein
MGIIGPFFFDCNVDQYVYQKMRDLELILALKSFDNLLDFWFQQDGATCHCTEGSLDLLPVYLGNRVISRRATIQWPPSDLNPLDFYLWEVLDNNVKKGNPKTINSLKSYIIEEVEKIDRSILPNVIKFFYKRLTVCPENDGGHFDDFL